MTDKWSKQDNEGYQRYLQTLNQPTWEPSKELDEDAVVSLSVYRQIVALLSRANDELAAANLREDAEMLRANRNEAQANGYRKVFISAAFASALFAVLFVVSMVTR